MNNRMAMIVAGVLAALAIFGIHTYVKSMEREVQVGFNLIKLCAAGQDLDAGTVLANEMITFVEVPERYVVPEAIQFQDRNFVSGKTLFSSVKRGSPFLQSHFDTGLGADAIAQNISPGMRAMSMQVDVVSGMAGLLRPGDYVDVLVTFDEELRVYRGGEVVFQDEMDTTFTILQNRRLVAAGTRLSNRAGADAASPAFASMNSYNTVTLEVTPAEAQLLAHSITAGERTTISLRSSKDTKGATENLLSTDLLSIFEKLHPGFMNRIGTLTAGIEKEDSHSHR